MGGTPARVFTLLALVLSVALLAAGTWAAYAANLRNDQYQLIHLGQCVHEGRRLYLDCWENKPPGMAWINAAGLALGGGRLTGVWLLPGIVGAACLGVFWNVLRRSFGPVTAASAMILAALVAGLRLYDGASIHPDYYSSMLELAACSFFFSSLQNASIFRRMGFGLFAGIVWTAATTVKQTGCTGLIAMSAATGVALLMASDRRRWLVSSGCAWIAFLAGSAVVVDVLHRKGLWPATWDALFTFNRSLWDASTLSGILRSWPRVHAALSPLQLPLWLGLIGMIAAWASVQARYALWAGGCVFWWAGAAAFALIGPSLTMRYWQATWPPMFWLAAMGIDALGGIIGRAGNRERVTASVVAATVLLLLGLPLVEHYKYGLATAYLDASGHPTERERLETAGARIAAIVPPGESIYVWAYRPALYVLSSRRNACRFTYPKSMEQLREITAKLSSEPPYALLIPIKGSPEFDRWCDEACQEQRRAVLTSFAPADPIDEFEVWLRKGPPRDTL